jgi:hypothetical protein
MASRDPLFRLVCPPAALEGAPAGWATEMLRDGDLALVPDGGGLEAVRRVAASLDLPAVSVLRDEEDATVQAHAGALPLVHVAAAHGEALRAWATKRGPMTLLLEVDGALPEDERRRVERFVAILDRQAE